MLGWYVTHLLAEQQYQQITSTGAGVLGGDLCRLVCPTTTTSNAVWGNWSVGNYQQPMYQFQQPPPPTAEQLAQIAAEQQRLEILARTQREEREAIDRRARELLEEHLDESARERFKRDNVIEIETARKNRYRIKRGQNVRRLDAAGAEEISYCIHPVESYPWEDTALAWLLMLRFAEDQFLATANPTSVRTGAALPRAIPQAA